MTTKNIKDIESPENHVSPWIFINAILDRDLDYAGRNIDIKRRGGENFLRGEIKELSIEKDSKGVTLSVEFQSLAKATGSGYTPYDELSQQERQHVNRIASAMPVYNRVFVREDGRIVLKSLHGSRVVIHPRG